MAAPWIRRQSGGRTRLVILGRPKRQLEAFDLGSASARYRLPGAANVLTIGRPLHPFWRMVVWLRRRLQPFGLFALERDLDAFHQW